MTRIGALFAGYGGLEMGVQAVLGGDLAWYSEIDKGALKILGHHHPDVPNVGDITAVDWSSVEPVDVLTGGFPCQDVSHAGKRAGLRPDTRTGLWSQMAYAIDQLRPALVVAENVRGLLSAEAHSDLEPCPWCMGDGEGLSPLRALGAVLGDLADLGYDAVWYGLRAADVGAPHGRFRVFVVAYPQGNAGRLGHGDGGAATDAASSQRQDGPGRDDAGGALVGPGFESGVGADAGNPPQGVRLVGRGAGLLPTPSVSDTNGAGVHGDGGLDLRTAVGLLPTPRATDGTKGGPNQRGSSGDLMLPSAVALLPTPSVADSEGGHERRGGARGDELLLNGVAKELSRLLPTPMVGSASPAAHGQISGQYRDQMAQALTQWGDYADAIARWEHTLGRPAPAPTMTSTKGNPQLAPTFVEWLMGLPPGHVTDTPGITRNEALKALGNGVVPQQAETALRFVLEHIGQAAA